MQRNTQNREYSEGKNNYDGAKHLQKKTILRFFNAI